jgi:hypothetical protein
MTQPKLTLLKSLKVLFSRLFGGRIHFLKEYTGKIFLMEDGKKFQVIRNLKVDPIQKSDKPFAVFTVCSSIILIASSMNMRTGLRNTSVTCVLLFRKWQRNTWSVVIP